MSEVMRTHVLVPVGEPISRDRERRRDVSSAGAQLLRWVATHPGLTSTGLAAAYLATVVALVAILASSALASPIGVFVGALFVLEVLVFVAIAAYVVIPEQSPVHRS